MCVPPEELILLPPEDPRRGPARKARPQSGRGGERASTSAAPESGESGRGIDGHSPPAASKSREGGLVGSDAPYTSPVSPRFSPAPTPLPRSVTPRAVGNGTPAPAICIPGWTSERRLAVGTQATLCGLAIEPDLNGSAVAVEGYDRASERFKVRIAMTDRVIRVKGKKLLVSPVE